MISSFFPWYVHKLQLHGPQLGAGQLHGQLGPVQGRGAVVDGAVKAKVMKMSLFCEYLPPISKICLLGQAAQVDLDGVLHVDDRQGHPLTGSAAQGG